MWEAVLLTVIAAAGNNIGKVLQKKGTRGLPRLSLDPKVLYAYLSNGTWVGGFVIDLSGALLMILAVARAPVSVVQPVSGCGLAILCVFSHFYLQELMHPRDWAGVACAAVGTVGMGVSGEPGHQTVRPFRLLAFVLSLALVMGGLEWWAHSTKARRRAHDGGSPPVNPLSVGADVIEEVATGTQAGACFGLSAAACRTGFLLVSTGYTPLFAAAGVAAGISLSSSGFFCQTRGFKEGRAVVVSTCAAVASIVVGVMVGMLALGEALPTSLLGRLVRFCSWGLIVVGIVILVHTGRSGPILPKELRRLLRQKPRPSAAPRPASRAAPSTSTAGSPLPSAKYSP